MKAVNLFMILFAVTAFALSASAESIARKAAVSSNEEKCVMRDETTVSINFNNNTEIDLLQVKPKMDAKIQEAREIAAAIGITSIEIQSMNYNVNSNNNSGDCGRASNVKTFNTSGSVSFKIKPSDKAAAFMAALMEKGYNANLYSNAYRQCGYQSESGE